MGRTLVNGDADVATVKELQKQYLLTPLSQWGKADVVRAERRDVLVPIEPEQDPLGPFKTLNAMLEENPPPADHALLLNQFARIGIGPGLDIEAQPDAVKQGLMRAELLGMGLLKQQFMSGDWANIVNGWRYPPPEIGRYGDDYLLRAADQSLAGIMCNDPAEAVYLVNFDDAEGNKLKADHRYRIHFDADDMPPVDSFWSLGMYGTDLNLVPNPIDRYSIGDRTAGLNKDADGGLTIYLQSESPGGDEEANWLPSPTDGEWFVILRLYRPTARGDRRDLGMPANRTGAVSTTLTKGQGEKNERHFSQSKNWSPPSCRRMTPARSSCASRTFAANGTPRSS